MSCPLMLRSYGFVLRTDARQPSVDVDLESLGKGSDHIVHPAAVNLPLPMIMYPKPRVHHQRNLKEQMWGQLSGQEALLEATENSHR